MNKPIQISEKEKKIIDRAVRNALCWGLGIVSTCKADLQEYSIPMTEEHAHYIFEKHVRNIA
jgi:hypothetical protein